MKYIFLSLLLSTAVSASINLYRDYSPRSQNYGGYSFPRNNYVLYRGIHPSQANYIRAIKAMLGDKTSNIESGLLYAVKLQLMGGNVSSFLSNLPRVRSEYIAYDLPSHIGNKKITDEEKAFDAAVKILSNAINANFSKSEFQNTFLNYSNAYRNDWPQGLMYSTVHIEVAKIYSQNILVYQENNWRSLDLNYWNKVNNNRWIGTNNEFPDKGEFLTPLYIPFNDVIGYQYGRNNKQQIWYVWENLQNDMDIAFYKARKNNKEYVLIVDGRRDDGYLTQTVISDQKIYYYADSTFDPTTKLPGYPRKHNNEVINILGVIEVCSTDCKTDIKKVFPEYEFKRNDITNHLNVDILSSLKINGEQVYLHTKDTIDQFVASETTETEVNQVPRPQVTKADNDKLIEKILENSENTLFDSDLNCRKSATNITCTAEVKKKVIPVKALVFKLPQEVIGKKVQNISIQQYQKSEEQSDSDKEGWDSTPAYSSIQLYHGDTNDTDPWKFYGDAIRHNPPKGSLFAEVISIMNILINDPPKQSLNFANATLKSNMNETILTDQLNVQAIRVQNVGVDQLYLLKVEFRFSL